jgi:hypothetical protein
MREQAGGPGQAEGAVGHVDGGRAQADHDSGAQPAQDHAAGRQQPDGSDLRGDEEPESETGEQRGGHHQDRMGRGLRIGQI